MEYLSYEIKALSKEPLIKYEFMYFRMDSLSALLSFYFQVQPIFYLPSKMVNPFIKRELFDTLANTSMGSFHQGLNWDSLMDKFMKKELNT